MSNDLVSQLKALKLHGMAQTLPELMAKARSHALDVEQVLHELLAAESAEREVKSLAYQLIAVGGRSDLVDQPGFHLGANEFAVSSSA